MQTELHSFEDIHRDHLTGAANQLAFFEWLFSLQQQTPSPHFSLAVVDLINFKRLNDRHGHLAGDAALCTVAGILQQGAADSVYRVGGDEFTLVFSEMSPEQVRAFVESISDNLDAAAGDMQLHAPVARFSILHYFKGEEITSGGVFAEMDLALGRHRQGAARILEFETGDLGPSRNFIHALANQLEQLARQLEESQRLAHSDPLTGLSNSRAAMEFMEMEISRSERTGEPFALLLIDGDDLRRYNDISYAAGDEMICKLGALQKKHLRGGDFIARWRMGDEFLVVMPETSLEHALRVGERIREAVEEGSRNWPLPVTISGGLAIFPRHGKTVGELVYQAELAKNRAKSSGKNHILAVHTDPRADRQD